MPIEPASAWGEFMAAARARVAQPQALEARGTLTRLTGLVLEAAGLRVPVGAQCQMRMPGQEPVLAEVVGFAGDKAFLMPAGSLSMAPAPSLTMRSISPVSSKFEMTSEAPA